MAGYDILPIGRRHNSPPYVRFAPEADRQLAGLRGGQAALLRFHKVPVKFLLGTRQQLEE
jgi:hypothetical protein